MQTAQKKFWVCRAAVTRDLHSSTARLCVRLAPSALINKNANISEYLHANESLLCVFMTWNTLPSHFCTPLSLCLDLVLWTCHFICPKLFSYCLLLSFWTFCFSSSLPCVFLSPSVSGGISHIFCPVNIPGFQPLWADCFTPEKVLPINALLLSHGVWNLEHHPKPFWGEEKIKAESEECA